MAANSDKNSLYLYCVIPKAELPDIAIRGMDGCNIYPIEYKDIMAIVSDSEYKVHDMSSENFMTHENIVLHFTDLTGAVPFNFGNVLKSKDDLTQFLDKTYPYIVKTLKKTEGKVEVGLKVFIRKEFLNSEIENNEIIAMKKQIEQMPAEAHNMLKVELGKLVKKALEAKQDELIQKLFEPLKKVSCDAKINACTVVNLVLNSSFLVEKDKLEAFSARLNELSPPYDEKYLLKFTGPWPTYNFVEMPE